MINYGKQYLDTRDIKAVIKVLKNELNNSQKDKSENIMIADLVRNKTIEGYPAPIRSIVISEKP